MTKDRGKGLFVLKGEIKTPPMSKEARGETGWLLRRLQEGETLGMPHSRPMPDVGQNCHELRVNDKNVTWRVIYYVTLEAVADLDVFRKKTPRTPQHVIDDCARRLRDFQKRLKGR